MTTPGPKPASRAFRVMTGLVGNAPFRKDLREELTLADSSCALRFDPAGRPGDRLTILWNIHPNEQTRVRVPWDKTAAAESLDRVGVPFTADGTGVESSGHLGRRLSPC